jgi:hypothetical protein
MKFTESEAYLEIPSWIKTPTLRKDVEDWENVLDQVNFLKGSYVGLTGRIAELEEQVELARKYQQELDAQFLVARGSLSHAKLLRERGIG